jgi:hypothetical protein
MLCKDKDTPNVSHISSMIHPLPLSHRLRTVTSVPSNRRSSLLWFPLLAGYSIEQAINGNGIGSESRTQPPRKKRRRMTRFTESAVRKFPTMFTSVSSCLCAFGPSARAQDLLCGNGGKCMCAAFQLLAIVRLALTFCNCFLLNYFLAT